MYNEARIISTAAARPEPPILGSKRCEITATIESANSTHAVRPKILIEPLDKFNGRDWYALSDPLSPFVGVYAINK